MIKIASILAVVISLTGCAGRHYAVCMQAEGGAGCSHKLYSKRTATEIGTLMASEPGSDGREVWILDMRKHKREKEAPQPAEKTEQSHDDKI